jgi:hypothetical protein
MAILQQWGDDYAYESATTADFTALAAAAAGEDLDWFFDPWLYQAGRPDYEYSYELQSLPGDSTLVQLQIDQVQSGVNPYRMPITVRLVRSGRGAADADAKLQERIPKSLGSGRGASAAAARVPPGYSFALRSACFAAAGICRRTLFWIALNTRLRLDGLMGNANVSGTSGQSKLDRADSPAPPAIVVAMQRASGLAAGS